MKQKTLSKLFLLTGFGLAFSMGAFLAVLEDILHDLPKLDQVKDYKPMQVSRVLDDDGQTIGEFYIEKRTLISISALPAYIRDAFLAAEDADFYQHQGIDYFGILRAALNEIKYYIFGGSRMGGSTITQQTAKTMLLSRQRTYTRKIKEFIIAKRIEKSLTKDQILNLYLNQIYFGNGVYGLEEASKAYYGVSAHDLTLSQAASLAAVPKSPNRINPIKDPERVRLRRNYVLDQMVSHGFVSELEADRAQKEPIKVSPLIDTNLEEADYFVEEVRRYLIAELGEEALYNSGLRIYTPINLKMQKAANESLRWGLRVLDKRQGFRGPIARLPGVEAERIAKKISGRNKVLNTKDRQLGVVKSISDENQSAWLEIGDRQLGRLPMDNMLWARKFNPDFFTRIPSKPSDVLSEGDIVWVRVSQINPELILSLEQTPLVEGALVSIEAKTSRVLAMVGGYDYNLSKFNRATQAKRQPGSSFKPFIYAAGIDAGVITPATLIDDSPREYEGWTPQNDTGKFLGEITVRRCLISSINICSITILEEVGIQQALDLADRIGVATPKTPMPRDLTLALGSGDVIPLLHVNAYSIFPNGGLVGKPILVDKVLTSSGQVLLENFPELEQAIKPASAFVITNIMRGWMADSGKRITGLKVPLAGKTGTTNDFRNAWFVGYSQDIVSGVYVGFDDNRSLGWKEYGARSALPIWGRFMEQALKVIPAREFVQPDGIVWRLIDPTTGDLAGANQIYDPGAMALHNIDESELRDNHHLIHKDRIKPPIMEAFVKGTEPGRVLEAEPLLSF